MPGIPMKKILLILAFTSTLLGQSLELTLNESIELGLKNSKEIKIAQSIFNYADAQVSEIFSRRLPRVGVSAGYARLSEIPPFQVSVPIMPDPIKIQDAFLNSYSLQLSVEQPLFTGFRLSSLQSAAEFNSKASEVDVQNEMNEKSYEIQSAFWNYLKSIQFAALIEENLKSLNRHVKDTEEFLKNGLVTKNDLLKLKVRAANVKLQLIDATSKMQIARSYFNKVIGLPLDDETKIIAEDISLTSNLNNYEALLEEAFSNRDILQSFQYKIKAGTETVAAANAGWFPQIFAFGNFYYNRPNQRILPLENKFNDTWDVGIGLKWNIWDWGNTSSKVRQAEQQLFQAEQNFLLLREAVELEVYYNYLTLEKELNRIDVSLLVLESAEENYRITSEKYYQQLATSTELIDSEVELINAGTSLLNSKIDFQIAKTKLEKSVGRKMY